MIKDILEVVLKTAGDIAQGYAQNYVQERFPDKSTDAERRRLLMVMGIGVIIGIVIIVVAIRAA